MSTVIIERVHSDVLDKDIVFDPPIVAQERCWHHDDTMDSIGLALGHAILQKGLHESVKDNAARFDAELTNYASVGDLEAYRNCIGNAFAAQGIKVYEVLGEPDSKTYPTVSDPLAAENHFTAA